MFRSLVLTLSSQGQDTSASALQWGVKYLTENVGPISISTQCLVDSSCQPSVQRKLHATIVAQNIGDQNPDWDDVDGMHYLDAVAWEILRLCTPSSTTGRQATQDVVVLGQVFPKGTTFVFHSALNGQINPKSEFDHLRSTTSKQSIGRIGRWESPLDFNPDRWLDASGAFDIKSGPAMPFGGGQRGCFGKTLAVLELKLFLFHLSRAFFFEQVPSELSGWEDRETIIRKPAQCFVKLSTWTET